MPPQKHIFLSYRSTQIDFALKLAADLKNLGVSLWVDRLDIKPSEDWRHSLQQGINDCAAMIVVLTPDYIESDYCQRELARADRMGYPIVPLLLESIPVKDFPMEVERTQYIDFSRWQDDEQYNQQLLRLYEFLKTSYTDQIVQVPSQEIQYINRLVAQLEASKRVIPAQGQADTHYRPVSPVHLLLDSYVLVTRNQKDLPEQVNLNEFLMAIEKYPRLAIVGAPATGKTAILEHLALQVAYQKQADPVDTPLPVVIRLSEWITESGFNAFLQEQWNLPVSLDRALAENRLMLFLDGVDEIPSDRDKKVRSLQLWLATDQAPRNVILTCRYSERSLVVSLGLPVLTIANLDREKVRQYVQFYLPPHGAEDFLKQLEIIESHTGIEGIATDMLFLSLLLELHSAEGLPANIGELFKALIARLWARERSRPAIKPVSYEELEYALAEIAFESMANQQISLDAAEGIAVHEHVLQFGVRVNLITIEDGIVKFQQEALLYYFAALWLSFSGQTLAWLEAHKQTPYFEQIALFAASMSSNTDAIVQLLAQHDPQLAIRAIAFGQQPGDQTLFDMGKQVMVGDNNAFKAIKLMSYGHAGSVVSMLVQLMRSGEWRTRVIATELLQKLGIGISETLFDTISDLDSAMREAASIAIMQLGESAYPALIKMVKMNDVQVQQNALWAIGEIGDRAFVPTVVDMLKDQNKKTVIQALQVLAYLHDTAAAPFIIDLLSHRGLSQHASETLQWMGHAVLPDLIHATQNHKVTVRQKVVQLLAQFEDTMATKAILATTYDSNIAVKIEAIKALENRNEHMVIQRLTECLEDDTYHRQTRKSVSDHAADALETINDENAKQVLEKWLMRKILQFKRSDSDKSANQAKERLKRISRNGDEVGQKDTEALLQHESPSVRIKAIAQIARMTPPIAVPLLARSVDDQDSEVRLAAVKTLSGFNTDLARQALLKALNDDVTTVVDAAAQSLSRFSDNLTKALIALLPTENKYTRQVIIQMLGRLGDPQAIPVLVDYLEDNAVSLVGEKRICDWSREALQAIGTPEALMGVELWKQKTEPKPPPDMPPDEHEEILNRLINEIRNDNWGEREEAVKALREYARSLKGSTLPVMRQRLVTLLADEDWIVRWAAVEALAWIGDKAVVPAIKPLLRDLNWTIRVAVIRALIELGEGSSADAIAECISDHHNLVREAALEALGILGGRSSIPVLASVLSDSDPFLRLAAVQAIGNIEHIDAVEPLAKALSDNDKNVRWVAADALRTRGDERALKPLIFALSDEDAPYWEVQRICDLAAEGLRAIGSQQALHAVETWQKTNSTRI